MRILNGEPPEAIKVPPQLPGAAVFDWRELRRWNINENRLPPGSDIRFQSPTPWEQYKWYVIAGAAFFVFEAVLVVLLARNLIRRRQVERSLRQAENLAQNFSRRLIQAQEAERSRLARELHDDVTQRLAYIAIEMAQKAPQQEQAALMRDGKIREEIVRLCEDVRSMAHNLHPGLLQYVGIAPALQAECDKFTRQVGFAVHTTFKNCPDKLPPEVAVCFE